MSSTEASYSRGANFESDNSDDILTPEEQRLHAAAKCCTADSIDEISLLVSGQLGFPPVDVNSRNAVDRTALHWAAGNNNVDALKVLIQFGASVDAKDIFGMNAILWAAWFGHYEAFCFLVKSGAATESKNKNGLSFLHCAATNNHVNIIDICRQELQDFNLDTVDGHQRTALHVAARGGNLESVEGLLDLKSDPHFDDKNGEVPLHLAAKHGHVKCVQCLVDFGADPNSLNKNNETPLHLACLGGYSDIVMILLDANAYADGELLSMENCCSGPGSCAETPSTVASSSMEEREVLRVGTRPLHHASQIGNREIISRLVQKGASINAVTELKQSALHLATIHSQLEGAEALLKFGINPNIRDNRSEAALHLAAENGSTELAEVLLKHGADIKVRDGKGKTPLMVAARGNYVTIVDMIIKAERFKNELSKEVLAKINFKPDSSIDTQFIRNLLFKLSTKYLRRNEWKLLGTYWKFSDTQIRSIEEQWIGEKSYREHAHRMLLIWLHGCLLSKQNPIKGIFEALCYIDRRDLAEQMRTKANQGPQDEKSCNIQ